MSTTPEADQPILTRAAYARRVGISRERVRQLEVQGRIVLRDGQVDVRATDEVLSLTMDTRQPASKADAGISREAQHDGAGEDAPRRSNVVALASAKLRAEEARALKLELEAGRLAGQLIELAQAEAVTRRAFAELRARLQGLGHNIADRLAAETDAWECGDLVQSAIDATLAEAAEAIEAGFTAGADDDRLDIAE